MARALTAAVKAEVGKAEVAPIFIVALDFASAVIRRWTGIGTLVFDNDTYTGSGDLLRVSDIEETEELRAAGLRVVLSGIPSSTLNTVLTENYQGRSAKVWLGFLDSTGALIADPALVFSGRMDTAEIVEMGDESQVTVAAASRLVDLERPRERRYTDQDQKLDYPDDKGFEYVDSLQEKEIRWGSKLGPPTHIPWGFVRKLYRGGAITIRQPITTRQIVYGQARVGGAIVFAHITNTNVLHLIVALAGHEVEEVGDVWFDDEVVPLDANGDATGTYAGFASVTKRVGDPNQAADSNLVANAGGKWTSDHRLRGVAYLYVKLTMDENKFHNGVPNITAIVKGKKIYDPRTKATAWSDNAALCLRDYLEDATFGLNDREFSDYGLVRNTADEPLDYGSVAASADDTIDDGKVAESASNIDDAAAITAADVSDQLVALAGGGSEKRYTVNGVIDSAEKPQAMIAWLRDAMAGSLVFTGGVWVMTAGKYVSPSISLVEKDMRGEIRVATKRRRRDLVNAMRGIYIWPTNEWQPTDFPVVLNPTFEFEDGQERFWGDLDLPLTTSSATAQRLAKIALERNHQHITAVLPCKLPALELIAGDTVKVSNTRLGWTDKVFEVLHWGLVVADVDGAPAIGIDLAVRELASTIFDWDPSEETQVVAAPAPDLPSDGLLTRIRRVGNIAETNQPQEWTEAQNFNATTLTDGATINWDVEKNQVASVTLAGNRTLANPTNLKDGGTYLLIVKQDAVGGRTLTFGTAYKWPGGVAPVLTTTAGAADIFTFVSDGTSMFGVKQLDFQ